MLSCKTLIGGILGVSIAGCGQEANFSARQQAIGEQDAAQPVSINFSLADGDANSAALALGGSITGYSMRLTAQGRPDLPDLSFTNATSVILIPATYRVVANLLVKLDSFTSSGTTYVPKSGAGFSTFAPNDAATFVGTGPDGQTSEATVKVVSQLPASITGPSVQVGYAVTRSVRGGNVRVTGGAGTPSSVTSVDGELPPDLTLKGAEVVATSLTEAGLLVTLECGVSIFGATLSSATCGGDALGNLKISSGISPSNPPSAADLATVVAGSSSFITNVPGVTLLPVGSAQAPKGGLSITRSFAQLGVPQTALTQNGILLVMTRNSPTTQAYVYSVVKQDATSGWEAYNFVPNVYRSACGAASSYTQAMTYRYVKYDQTSGLWMGIVLCINPATGGLLNTRYKLYLANAKAGDTTAGSGAGKYFEATDTAGNGQDHCQLLKTGFTIANEDSITSGNCPGCAINYFGQASLNQTYYRGTFGSKFTLYNSATSSPWGQQAAGWIACDTSVP